MARTSPAPDGADLARERLIVSSRDPPRALGRSFAIDIHIGRRLRRRRRDLGLSQAALADAIGVRFQQIQKYESGLNKLSAARLWGVATALGVTPNFFFVGLAGAEALAEDG